MVAAALCVAGVALGDGVALGHSDRHFAWQTRRLLTSTVTLHGTGVAHGHTHIHADIHTPICTHARTDTHFPTLPPSRIFLTFPSTSPFFCDLLEEVDMWGYPVLELFMFFEHLII